jgi:hypothetical protein
MPAPRKDRKQTIIAAGTAAGVVALYLVVAAVAHIAPFGKSTPVAHPTPTPTPTVSPSTHKPTPAPSATLAAGVLPLLQLLPQDITDPATQCQAVKKPYSWSMPGLVSALTCNDPDLAGGSVNGYQMDSRADFDAAWRNFNTWWNFDSARAQAACPPSGSSAQGLTTWHGQGFPSVRGQVLECEMVTGNAPVYVWTLPTQDMFLIAEGADGSSFKALNSWWTSSNSGPSVTPSATPSAGSS